MDSKVTSCACILLCVLSFGCHKASSSPRPLSKSELLALVAAETLPDNIVSEIRLNGLNFTPDASYLTLLQNAGVDRSVTEALSTARQVPVANAATEPSNELLTHLSNAGSLIRAKNLDAAAKELSVPTYDAASRSALEFVMGDVLIAQGDSGAAGGLFSDILDRDPAFPDIHVLLSLTSYNTGDPEECLRQAHAALQRDPRNPVAHMNSAVCMQVLRKFDGAKAEYLQAILNKPDYEMAYANLGILLDNMRDYDGAVEQYRKAINLKPGDVEAHYNLGVAYGHRNDWTNAIREYREVKRLDPDKLEARQNLGSALLQQDPAAAITEFRELAELAPNFQICHVCLAGAYLQTGRLPDAEKEYLLAAKLNPADPHGHIGLGKVYETQKKYEQAIKEYHLAEHLEPGYAESYADAGRVLTLQKNFPAAIAELQQAEDLAPADWLNHDQRGQALEASGDRVTAIAEYQSAVFIAPKELQARLHLAEAQEKNEDWVAALGNYQRAAQDEAPPQMGIPQLFFDAQNKLHSAQKRYQQHLADLRSAGKFQEADALEARRTAAEAGPNVDERYHNSMQASTQALQERRFDDAETAAKEAVSLAEKIQPPDGRLPESVGQLGTVYAWRLNYPQAAQAFQRQLTLSQQLFGAQSPQLAMPLQNLAMTAVQQKYYTTAETLFNRAIELNQKTYGQDSTAVADTLRNLSHVYTAQKDYAKSEATLLRSVRIYETLYGADDDRVSLPLTILCSVYDQWGKADKSESCHGRIVELAEKQFGANSPYLVRDLTAQAQMLRRLGRASDAANLEKRVQTIQSAQVDPK